MSDSAFLFVKSFANIIFSPAHFPIFSLAHSRDHKKYRPPEAPTLAHKPFEALIFKSAKILAAYESNVAIVWLAGVATIIDGGLKEPLYHKKRHD